MNLSKYLWHSPMSKTSFKYSTKPVSRSKNPKTAWLGTEKTRDIVRGEFPELDLIELTDDVHVAYLKDMPEWTELMVRNRGDKKWVKQGQDWQKRLERYFSGLVWDGLKIEPVVVKYVNKDLFVDRPWVIQIVLYATPEKAVQRDRNAGIVINWDSWDSAIEDLENVMTDARKVVKTSSPWRVATSGKRLPNALRRVSRNFNDDPEKYPVSLNRLEPYLDAIEYHSECVDLWRDLPRFTKEELKDGTAALEIYDDYREAHFDLYKSIISLLEQMKEIKGNPEEYI